MGIWVVIFCNNVTLYILTKLNVFNFYLPCGSNISTRYIWSFFVHFSIKKAHMVCSTKKFLKQTSEVNFLLVSSIIVNDALLCHASCRYVKRLSSVNIKAFYYMYEMTLYYKNVFANISGFKYVFCWFLTRQQRIPCHLSRRTLICLKKKLIWVLCLKNSQRHTEILK